MSARRSGPAPRRRRGVTVMAFCLALAIGCAPAAPQRRPSADGDGSGRTADGQPARKPAQRTTARGSFEEKEIGDAPELQGPTNSAPMLPSIDSQAAPTPAEPEPLVTRINPSTPPNVAAALRLIEEGRKQRAQGRHDKALDAFERAVAIDPTNPYGYYFLAQLHYLNKNYDQAIAFASRAAVLSAKTDRTCLGRVYSLQGAVFEEVGRYPDARKAYKSAVDADPNNVAARVGVGRLADTVDRTTAP